MALLPDEEGNQADQQAGRAAGKNPDADIVGQKFDGGAADNPSDNATGGLEDGALG